MFIFKEIYFIFKVKEFSFYFWFKKRARFKFLLCISNKLIISCIAGPCRDIGNLFLCSLVCFATVCVCLKNVLDMSEKTSWRLYGKLQGLLQFLFYAWRWKYLVNSIYRHLMHCKIWKFFSNGSIYPYNTLFWGHVSVYCGSFSNEFNVYSSRLDWQNLCMNECKKNAVAIENPYLIKV